MLDRRASRFDPAVVGVDVTQAADQFWEFEFVVKFSYGVSTEVDHTWEDESIAILPNLVHLPGGRCASHSSCVPLREYLSAWPLLAREVAAQGSGQEAARPASRLEKSKMAVEHPWALEYLDGGVRFLKKHRGQAEEGRRHRGVGRERPCGGHSSTHVAGGGLLGDGEGQR